MRFYTAFLLILSVNFGYTQNLVPKAFGIEEGLPFYDVTSIVEDSVGYLWIGTNGGGIARFDGKDFFNLGEQDGLENNAIINLYIDQSGRLWVTTARGVSMYNGKSFTNLLHDSKTLTFAYIFEFNNEIFAFQPSLGNISTFATVVNDSTLKSTSFISEEVDTTIRGVLPFSTEIVGLVTRNKKLILVSARDTSSYQLDENVEEYLYSGNVVLLQSKSKLLKFDLGTKALTPINASEVIPILGDNMIAYDQLFDSKNTNLMKLILPQTNLNYTTINGLLRDREGVFWIKSSKDGLIRLVEGTSIELSDKTFKSNAILIDKNNFIWIGTDGDGLHLYREDSLIRKWNFGSDLRNRINCLVEDNSGNIWIGTAEGLAKCNLETKKFSWDKSNEIGETGVTKLATDLTGTIWCMLETGGVARLDNDKFVKIYKKGDGLYSNWGWDLRYFKRAKALFVCAELGISYFDTNVFEKLNVPVLNRKLLLSIDEYSLHYFLVATGGNGLYIIDRLNPHHFINLTAKDGLPSNFIHSVDVRDDSTIWIGTIKGLAAINLSDSLTLKSIRLYGNLSRFENYRMVHGRYRVQRDNANLVTYPLHFTSIKLFMQDELPLSDAPRLSYNENHLTFRFNRINKGNPEMIRYKFKLENWDSQWSTDTHQTSVTYSKLPPGDYVFKVISTVGDGHWDKNELHYPFTIRTLVYQRAWFRTLAFLFLISIIFLVFYFRYKQKLARRLEEERIRNREGIKLRKEIGRDFHDEMGNQLARIINYVGQMKMKNSDTNILLDKTEQTSKYLLSGTRDFLWAIDPLNDNLDSLKVHIRDFGEKILSEKGIEFRVYSTIDENLALPFGYTRQINLIFKEALTNTFKHSQATSVRLYFERKLMRIMIALEDNGIGLSDQRSMDDGEGLANMKNRSLRIGGTLDFVSSPSSGTRVELSFNLNEHV